MREPARSGMTAEVSQSFGSIGSVQAETIEKQVEDKVLEEARSIFRKFSITIGGRKNSTKSLKSLGEEGANAAEDATARVEMNDGKSLSEVAPAPDDLRDQQASQDLESPQDVVRIAATKRILLGS